MNLFLRHHILTSLSNIACPSLTVSIFVKVKDELMKKERASLHTRNIKDQKKQGCGKIKKGLIYKKVALLTFLFRCRFIMVCPALLHLLDSHNEYLQDRQQNKEYLYFTRVDKIQK